MSVYGKCRTVGRRTAPLLVVSLVLAGCRVTRDQREVDAWQVYGNDNTLLTDWTGGDGAHSVALGDGRVVWMFGDSFLGRIEPGSPPSRAATEPNVANTFVVRRGTAFLQTLRLPLRPPAGSSFNLWPRQGLVQDGRLKLFAGRTSGGAGAFLATFSLDTLQQVDVQPTPTSDSTRGISWGLNLYEGSDYLYIYGTRLNYTDAHTYVARAPPASLLGPWQYRTAAGGWSPNESDAAPIAYAADGVEVKTGPSEFVLVGKKGNGGVFSPSIVGFRAAAPYGPFPGDGAEIYRTPENDGSGTTITYATHFHPHDITSQGMLFSYCVCSGAGCRAGGDASAYRPRFLRLLP